MNQDVFPNLLKDGDKAMSTGGLTLRDYFAAQAMAGFLAVPGGINPQADAHLAYLIADAMLAERMARLTAAGMDMEIQDACAAAIRARSSQ